MAMSKSMKLYAMSARSALKESIIAETRKSVGDRDGVCGERAIREGNPGEEPLEYPCPSHRSAKLLTATITIP